MLGLTVSLTVTVKLQLAMLPLLSLAVQLTIVVPVTKMLPLAGVHVTLVTVQLSLVPGAGQVTTWLHATVVLVTTLAGQVMLGFSESATVTLKLQDA